MANRKYLDDIGWKDFKKEMKKDGRINQWAEERKKYSFDQRDTWSLNTTVTELMYERLKMFKEVAPIDLEFHKIKFDGEEWTQGRALDFILESFEKVSSGYYDVLYTDEYKKMIHDVTKAYRLFAEFFNAWWW